MIRALALALVLAIGAALWLWGSKNTVQGQRDAAIAAQQTALAELKATQNVLETERTYSRALHVIAVEHEEAKNEIERQAAADLADLRSGNLRLHDRWQACAATADLSAAVSAAGQSHGGADDRSASAVRAVRAAAECDAAVRGLQAVVRSDRGE